jgi:hypothetical protein
MLAQPKAGAIDKILKPKGWNQYEIRCEGSRIRRYINGTQTIDFTETDPKTSLTGVIALQIHSGAPTEAWYNTLH